MPRRTLDQSYDEVFANSRDLEIWMRSNYDTIRRRIAVEGGFTTTMAVIKKRKIVNRQGRNPSLRAVEAMWMKVEAQPNRRLSAGEIAPGVRFLENARPPPAAVREIAKPPDTAASGAVFSRMKSVSELSALELRNSRRPQMPEVVRRTESIERKNDDDERA